MDLPQPMLLADVISIKMAHIGPCDYTLSSILTRVNTNQVYKIFSQTDQFLGLYLQIEILIDKYMALVLYGNGESCLNITGNTNQRT